MFPKAASAGAIVLAGLLLFGCSSNNKKSQKQSQQPALKAEVLTVSPRTVQLSKDYSALLRSRRQVQVVARVTGFLKARYYNEGAHVKKGQKLFTIEQAPYQATVEQQKANLASAKARQYNAQVTFNRTAKLYKSTNGKGTSKQAYDNDLANLKSAKAAAQQAKAALDQAQINLGYTQVTANVSGQISLRNVNVGNLVQSGTRLATITPLNPIEARFSLSVGDATLLRHQRHHTGQAGDPAVTAVLHSPMEPKSLTGHVNYLDAEVNRQTSTVLARATFQNPGGYYLPGQFVRVKLRHLQVPHVLAVPEVAVTQGQSGSELYVLGKHNKARSQQVELGQSFGHGGKPFAYWVIVKQGLKPGARVVVNHIASVKAGERIKPQALPGKARSNKRHRSIGIEKKRGPGQ